MLHPCGPIFVVLLALAERTQVSGRAFLVAFAAGVEVACRLTKSLAVAPADANMAWSQTGIVCGPATALAAGKLLGLDHEQLQWALGISASESAGTRATHGSMAASLIFGRAAQSGLRAAVLAQKGFTSSSDSIERGSGFAEVFSRRANLPALLDGLGVEFELLANTYKPYPCGTVIHPATEAVLTLKRQHGFLASDISQIILEVYKGAVEFGFRPQPKDDIEAKVSVQHWAAVAALCGKAGIGEGTIAMVQDPEVRRLCKSMLVTPNASFNPSAAQATVVLRSGERLACRVDNVIGSVERPMTDQQVTEKCVDQAELAIGSDRARELVTTC
jgi:2-methylcitrate dehydratase PrpD